MLNEYCMMLCEPCGMNWKPESRLLALRFVQGEVNDDCVTVWFFDTLYTHMIRIHKLTNQIVRDTYNWNAMVSPSFAVMLLGLNVSVPLPPTVMTCKSAMTETAGSAMAAKSVEKRMLDMYT